ncbi:MAG TPA: ATP-binding cassette domain-containing protein [Mesotoga infera]|jgi:peptide/nickel transport system ATP-binding protein|uniref:Dipeptide transporter ATP-binding component of ABC superfamily n=1 Tax=Mesotoga infera TaxID=1236046 RepID=A0A7Z7LFX3_9BACT|nr:oligopeptide/dipeptide ABC transporter ATP-binding protein [Mesotoga infera]MBP8659735.1 ATP-binding cassette domain-containing protein [Mesotoga sp.]NLI07045.1 ATP-binding cassette domain-containing protein [Thermotogaceae bacterium]SSC13224.1 dipeptide transporter; ATP-binding component of ABC superfamily [Mesotoga infera]HNR79356.1 ATP-binding cassette domain-containing protein [Mesotoga infera]HOI33828.1 ATP-binding cassette domain-containing protein [Mesotoga infera]
MKLLEVKNLKKYFPIKQGFLVERVVGFVKAVDDVSFSVDRGKTIGIVGESGCGKTTIGKSIIRLHEVTDGEMLIDEEDTTFYFMKRKRALQYLKSKYFKNPDFDGDGSGLETYKKKIHDVFVKSDRNPSKTLNTLFENLEEKKRLLRRKAQIVFQDPMSSLNPRMTVGQMLAEPLLFHKIAEKMDDAIVMVKDLLVKVGLKAYHVDRYPHQFSGGQRQRIAVARAISVNPELIVLDEPTSALDVSVQAQIVNLFEELQEQLNAGYVFISHNLALVRFICQEVSVMYLGRIVEQGDSESIFDAPLHPYTKALLAAAPIPDPNKKRNRKDLIGGQVPSPINRPSGCFFNPRCKYRMDICTREYPQMFKVDQKHFVACHLYSTSQEQGGEK